MTGRSAAPASRRARAVESFRSAAEAIGPVVPEMSLFLVTRGQFSLLDMVQHVFAQLGRAEVSVWTWAIADYEVEAMAGLMANAAIVGARLIVDRSAEQRSAPTIDAWRQRFGLEAVRVCKNHAKMARVWTSERRVLIRGSCNLNWNPRYENVDVTEGGEDFDLVARLEDELPVLRPMCSNAEAESASKLSLAFEASELAMFSGVKPWSIGTRAK
jgi:hypothetical protein